MEFLPEKARETLPVTITIRGGKAADSPKLFVESFGEIPLKKTKHGYQAQFYSSQAGRFEVRAVWGQESLTRVLQVEAQVYMNFQTQFGWFFALFLGAIGGLVLWHRRIKSKKS